MSVQKNLITIAVYVDDTLFSLKSNNDNIEVKETTLTLHQTEKDDRCFQEYDAGLYQTAVRSLQYLSMLARSNSYNFAVTKFSIII